MWQGCARLIVNGDVAEVHHPTRWGVAARHVLRLHDLCEDDGVELTLLSGNHDPYLTDLRHLELAGGAVFVTHGDVLHPAVAPWSPRAGIMRQAHERAIAAIPEHERDHLDTRLKVSQFASHAEWAAMAQEAKKSTVPRMLLRPWSMPQVLSYWWRFPRLAAKFMAEHAPHAMIGVFGHTHHAGIWNGGAGRTIINTGCYGFPGRPRGVMVDESNRALRVVAIERDSKLATYRLATDALRTFDLAAAPPPLAA